MGKSIRIGSVVGAPVLVSPWWFVIAAFLTFLIAPNYRGWLPDGAQSGGAYVLGAAFVVLLYLSAFLHELGHAFTARAFDLQVHRIELTALGGLTQMDSPPTPGKSAVTSAAGPAVNVALVGVAFVALQLTAVNTLPHLFAIQLAWTNALIAGFNLIPGLPLDGGAILRAGIWKATGRTSTATVVAAWSGRVVAILAGAWYLRLVIDGGSAALINGLLLGFVAFWMWTASTAALESERTRARVTTLTVRSLTRPIVLVAADDPVSVVMRRIGEVDARGALITDTAGHITGILSEAAVAAAPRERWPWIAASDVSRRFDDRLALDPALEGNDLMRALAEAPATEYLVSEPDGTVVGVLAFADVEAALTRR